MLILGLTGKTGAGKSTVADFLRKKGCFIIDGDVVAREIVLPGMPALEELAVAFGREILNVDGSLDRKALAAKAFSCPENTELLNKITHPFIKRRFEQLVDYAKNQGCRVAVIDAAALLESDCKDLCEKIIVVYAPEEVRLERILERDGISKEQALIRMKGQKEDAYYLDRADYIIRNYGEFSYEKQLEAIKELFYE